MEYKDYSLVGQESKNAIANGLADATWYTAPVSREDMRRLLERENKPAIIDTIIWFSLLLVSGYLIYFFWGNWIVVFPIVIYSVLYASVSDSRWHETSHGTAFKSDWMNNWLYQISSFMVFRQPTLWRWSHARHHSDTIIVGRDPEIVSPRPPDLWGLFLNLFALKSAPPEFKSWFGHLFGKISAEEREYLPKSEYAKVILEARIWGVIFAMVIALSVYFNSVLPFFYIGFPTLIGSYMISVYGLTQHAGLAENVLDHRLNCRTVYMNKINRFLYWNMNYHLEHHMFPLVPYYNLPELHALIKPYCPEPYNGLWGAWKEIIPALLKQVKDPSYFVERELPKVDQMLSTRLKRIFTEKEVKVKDGWADVCALSDLPKGEVVRFDYLKKTFAIYRTSEDNFYATDGICSHGNAHLADGLVIGGQIECPKHNGRFNLEDGSPARPPVCIGLKTYRVKKSGERVLMDLDNITESNEGHGVKFKVKSNKNVATFIKEITLEPVAQESLQYKPGQYVQFGIPAYGEIDFDSISIDCPFDKNWERDNLFSLKSQNEIEVKRNYSMASNPVLDKELKFNVRIALPPNKTKYRPGIGSSFVFNLKPGDELTVYGPYGDFLIDESDTELLYIGGGAGMAPIKSHLSYLFEVEKTKRKVSFWYGARSKSEIFYREFFEQLDNEFENFSFHISLSSPNVGDNWDSYTGFIHEVVFDHYLKKQIKPMDIQYFLCGPPLMIKACHEMLEKLNVPQKQIKQDEF